MLDAITDSCEITVVYRLLNAKSHAILRAIARTHGVKQGHSKSNTINNLIAAGCVRLTIEWLMPHEKEEY